MRAAPDVAIVECGIGNLHSIEKAVRLLSAGASVELTDDPGKIAGAGKVVFPGDGAFGHCMEQIDRGGLRAVLAEAAQSKPFMGICIGMQLLFEHSEEGDAEGLGVLPGRVVRFAQGGGLKIPHMGWNRIAVHPGTAAPPGVVDGRRFYFIHSYHAETDPGLVLATCTHTEEFAAIVGRGDLIATQFHPEKSHAQGLEILKGFLQKG